MIAASLVLLPSVPAYAEDQSSEQAVIDTTDGPGDDIYTAGGDTPSTHQPAPAAADEETQTANGAVADETTPDDSDQGNPSSADPDPDTEVDPDDEVVPPPTSKEVSSAQLRWGMSNEANNSAFASNTFNHFSAGRIADPTSGGMTLTANGARWSNGRSAAWSAAVGNVSIEKFTGSSYRRATWAGLSTDSSGRPLGNPLSGTFSNHQIVFGAGTGTVDLAEGTATIEWKGDATVLFYSGMSFFYISDPRLVVADGIGTVTATLGGFGSSQANPTVWKPLPSTEVTLADLKQVDLTQEAGFTVKPEYSGVQVTGVAQDRGPHFGSFPQSFIDFQNDVGTAAFWHSSGGSADRFKPTLPMTISYDAANSVRPPSPRPEREDRPDEVDNNIKKPPTKAAKPAVPTPVAAPGIAPPTPLTAVVAPPSTLVVDAPAFQQVAQATTTWASGFDPRTTTKPTTVWWWLGLVFLILAGSSVAGTYAYSAAATRR